MNRKRVAQELESIGRLLLGADEDEMFLDAIAAELGKKFKSKFIGDTRMPDVRGVLMTDYRPVHRKFKPEYESRRGYSVRLSIDEDGVRATLMHGDPNFRTQTVLKSRDFRPDAAKAIAAWATKEIKDDLKKGYTWDEPPEKLV